LYYHKLFEQLQHCVLTFWAVAALRSYFLSACWAASSAARALLALGFFSAAFWQATFAASACCFFVQRCRRFQLFILNFLEFFGLSFVFYRGFAQAGFAKPLRTPENCAVMIFISVLSI
jgi:hypothetical protein